MSQTQTLTITQIYPTGPTLNTATVGGPAVFFNAIALDANGEPSGAIIWLSSSNASVGELTTASQIGNAPAGVAPVGSGTVTITATASDNTSLVASFSLTVS